MLQHHRGMKLANQPSQLQDYNTKFFLHWQEQMFGKRGKYMENNKKTNWRETEEKLAQLLQDAESKKNYAYEVIGQIKKQRNLCLVGWIITGLVLLAIISF